MSCLHHFCCFSSSRYTSMCNIFIQRHLFKGRIVSSAHLTNRSCSFFIRLVHGCRRSFISELRFSRKRASQFTIFRGLSFFHISTSCSFRSRGYSFIITQWFNRNASFFILFSLAHSFSSRPHFNFGFLFFLSILFFNSASFFLIRKLVKVVRSFLIHASYY